ncbi:unnamed protein product [marine sediment metagenome]|uniref:Uncharacterized protein n=1 Tax=marine sediment metagenome TaxID=412755 RepID=X1DG86_9ZZZZ
MKSNTPNWFNWKNIISIICVSGTVGISLKWVTVFDRWVYFPFFPDILDASFLIFSVLFLAVKGRKR